MVWVIQISPFEKRWLSSNGLFLTDFDKAVKFNDWGEARLAAKSLNLDKLIVISAFNVLVN